MTRHDPAPAISRITDRLVREVTGLTFADPVTVTYNPLRYARRCFNAYIRRYARGGGQIVLLGMNPGPWGMAQTGVPFGEVSMVRDWLNIRQPVGKPDPEHPKRTVEGFACKRREVSGARLWGWARQRFETPDRFFRRFFVANYCPLVFLESTGRNRTPDKLPASERVPLFEACDVALRALVEALQARRVVGIGAFAEKQACIALADRPVQIGRILHPSPASPAANTDWAGTAERQLCAAGIDLPA